jgi:hypothetical protein
MNEPFFVFLFSTVRLTNDAINSLFIVLQWTCLGLERVSVVSLAIFSHVEIDDQSTEDHM